MPIRVATFNVENLLQRFDFYRYGQLTAERALSILGVDPTDEDYLTLRRSLFVTQTDDTRQMTAQAIRDTRADLIGLQEVESRPILDIFYERYVRRSTPARYGWRRLVDGNDIRGIDVGVMSRNWIRVTSHADHTFHDFGLHNQELEDYGLDPGDRIFRRDCLEVETNADGQDFFVFICHFKSMSGGRDHTMPVRRAEAAAVRRIIEDKWNDPAQHDWMIIGDLNDYVEEGGQAVPNGLEPLFDGGFSVNLMERAPEADRWTHYYPPEDGFHQIDYLLASPSLAQKNPNAVPEVIRGGQPLRVPGIENVDRYPRVGFDRPKASDHCPIVVEVSLA